MSKNNFSLRSCCSPQVNCFDFIKTNTTVAYFDITQRFDINIGNEKVAAIFALIKSIQFTGGLEKGCN